MRVIHRTVVAGTVVLLAASMPACGSSPDRRTEMDTASVQAKGTYDPSQVHPDSTTGLPGRTGQPGHAGEGGARTPQPPRP